MAETQGWAYGGAPQPGSASFGTVTIVEGITFCISAANGDIEPGGQQGLFFRDTRFLSLLRLTLDGQRVDHLTAQSASPYTAKFVARRPPGEGTADSTLLVLRRRSVGNGMVE